MRYEICDHFLFWVGFSPRKAGPIAIPRTRTMTAITRIPRQSIDEGLGGRGDGVSRSIN